MNIIQHAFPYREFNQLPPDDLQLSEEDDVLTALFAFIICGQDISGWDTSNVTSMKLMFYKGIFLIKTYLNGTYHLL